MRPILLALVAASFALPSQGQAIATLRIDYSNPGLTPSNWTLVIHPDGSGHFHADRGDAPAQPVETMQPVAVDRDIHVSQGFADNVFRTVHTHQLMNEKCASHLKVAFQGWKKITYSGPDGEGSCAFNYAKDKDIQALGDSLVAVASTIIEGARLELLYQHDPLGLSQEIDYVMDASSDGRLQQICAIRGILEKLEEDPGVMERVRKRARVLAQSQK